MKTCRHCGEAFRPKFAAAKLCFDCWQERELMFETYPELLRELRTLKARLERTSTPAIPKDIHRMLLQLCHPDRHDNSRVSNTVTRWLLEQRA